MYEPWGVGVEDLCDPDKLCREDRACRSYMNLEPLHCGIDNTHCLCGCLAREKLAV